MVSARFQGETLPWDEPGWDARAEAWIREQGERAGLHLTGAVEEVRRWCLACVLRAPTDGGTVYFKEALNVPLWADEPALAATMGELYPGFVPEVIAVDTARRWLLTMDCGDAGDGDSSQADVALLRRHANLQRRAADDTERLLNAGCSARPCSALPADVDAALADTSTMALVDDAVRTHLAALRERIAAACADLDAYAIPDTLAHGDLGQSNAALRDGEYVIFDWTDACITHPFMDGMLAFGMEPGPAKDPAIGAMIEPWTDYESRERLREAWAVAKLVACAHTFVTYHAITAYLPDSARHEHVDGLRDMSSTLIATGERLRTDT